MIEVLKYMFLGESAYFSEAPPRRLRDNPLWSKEKIKQKACEYLDVWHGDIECVISVMRSSRIANDESPALRVA